MVNQDQIIQFIELKAKGYSLDKISKQLEISKPTLVKLARQYEKEVSNEQYFNYETLLEKFKLSRELKTKYMVKMLRKINKELLSRDLSNLEIKDLLKLREQLDNELKSLLNKVRYYTDEKSDLMKKLGQWDEEITINLRQ